MQLATKRYMHESSRNAQVSQLAHLPQEAARAADVWRTGDGLRWVGSCLRTTLVKNRRMRMRKASSFLAVSERNNRGRPRWRKPRPRRPLWRRPFLSSLAMPRPPA